MTEREARAAEQVAEIFGRIADEPSSRHEELLDELCAGDPGLRSEVASLLQAHCAAEDAFDGLDTARASDLIAWDEAQGMPERTGPYRLIEEIGHGGMGTVYLGERVEGGFDQRVAVKLLKRGMDSDAIVERFLTERRILASLEHPWIARLLDGGLADDGRPYFAMEYVEGEPLFSWCDRRRLPLSERLELFERICRAVQHAHARLIVHRDLKPANILVTADGEPKLLDFGIAKLLAASGRDEAALTAAGRRLMTPEYAAPEQVRGEPVTVVTDVYSLGVLLYELLTGRHPYAETAATLADLEGAVCTTRPPAPSAVFAGERGRRDAGARGSRPDRLRRRLRGDLDTIVLKALAKEPERRYASVEALAEDLRAYSSGLPVKARPETVAYRARRFVGRHRAAVGASAAAVLALTTGLALALWQGSVAQQERDRARAEAAKAEQVAEFLAGVFRLSDPRQSKGEEVSVRTALDRGAEQIELELSDQPVVQAELMDVLGGTYRELGDFDAARDLLERALALRRRHLAPDDPDVAGTLRKLGLVWHQQGEYERARALYLEAAEIVEHRPGPSELELSAVLNNLGLLYRRTGEYPNAVEAFERALAIRERHLGPEAMDVGKVVNNLGTLLYSMGEDERARTLYERALAIYERELGPDHPMVAGTLGNLGLVRQRLGEHDGLEPMYRRMLAIQRKAYGPSHSEVGTALGALGSFLKASERYDEAIEVYEEAVRVLEEALGPEHPFVAYPLSSLGDLYLSTGRPTEALAHFRRAAEVRETALGSDHPLLAGCLEGLGRAQAELGETIAAEHNLHRALAIQRRTSESGGPAFAPSLVHLGRLLVETGRCTEAVGLLDEAAPLRVREATTSDPDLAEIHGLLAACESAPAS